MLGIDEPEEACKTLEVGFQFEGVECSKGGFTLGSKAKETQKSSNSIGRDKFFGTQGVYTRAWIQDTKS